MGRTFGWSIVSTLIDAFHRLRDAIHNARHGQESFDAIGAVKQAGMYLISTERGRIGVAFFAVLATAVFLAPRWIWRLLYAIKCLLTLLVSVRTHALRFGGKNYSVRGQGVARIDWMAYIFLNKEEISIVLLCLNHSSHLKPTLTPVSHTQ